MTIANVMVSTQGMFEYGQVRRMAKKRAFAGLVLAQHGPPALS